jgi:hypothetical protein
MFSAFRLYRVALALIVISNATLLFADQKTDAARYVKPINWSRFKGPKKITSDYELGKKIAQNAVRFNLGWMENQFKTDPATNSYIIVPVYDKKNPTKFREEQSIRPGTSAAFAVAVILKTRAFDESVIGISEKETRHRLLKLIKGLASIHLSNSKSGFKWGDHWQSAHWASYLGIAGWLMWDDLDDETRRAVANLVEHEANRFIAPNYRVPYWAIREKIITPKDTKAEENAWDSMILQTAVAMMPTHPHVQQWKTICTKLMISSFARRSDMDDAKTMIDGKPIKDWLDGYNVQEEGFLINHGIMHPDYMLTVVTTAHTHLVQSLAGQTVSQAADFNGPLVYRAFTTHEWPSPPNKKPGGTIYQLGKAEIYYPQGTDWSNYRFDSYYRFDLTVKLLGWDRDSKQKVDDWMRLRAERILQMQERHEDRHLFAKGEFDTYGLPEQQTASTLADGFLMQWLDWHNELSPVGNWLE